MAPKIDRNHQKRIENNIWKGFRSVNFAGLRINAQFRMAPKIDRNHQKRIENNIWKGFRSVNFAGLRITPEQG